MKRILTMMLILSLFVCGIPALAAWEDEAGEGTWLLEGQKVEIDLDGDGAAETAWIETVPETYVRSYKATPDFDRGTVRIEVDGGIKAVNAAQTVAAGADVLVAGSSIFNKKTPVEQAVKALQDALK